MNTVDNYNFAGKRALVRVDFNVPLDKTTLAVTDDARIRAAVPTIKKILNDGGSVVLMSHLGRPLKKLKEDGSIDRNKFTLQHVVDTTTELMGVQVKFADDCIGDSAQQMAKDLKAGEILLLENLRFYKEEEKGDEQFAQKLATLGDVYVNDAFGTAHRAHASTAVIAKFFAGAKMFGYVMANELDNANKILNNAERPFTAIMGGAKVSDKILIIEQLLNKVDHLIIGGAMAYTFAKAQGGNIGNSLCEDDKLDLALDLIAKAKAKGVQLHLPVDSLNGDSFANDAKLEETQIGKVTDGYMGLDIGPLTIATYTTIVSQSKTILWNGPMGVFEMPTFERGTRAIAKAIVVATTAGAYSLVGGGDSAAAINQFGWGDKVSYVSTGGGALLEYIEGKELPGVKMIMED
ncbi:MAG: phosphoglycerate kinase [Bacteroidetes bacterium]|nr:phosphoglycerate kinase [Bacteroidota bacterium]